MADPTTEAGASVGTAGASVTGAASNTGSTNAGSEAIGDIDTGEGFKSGVFSQAQTHAFNLKELTEKWSNLSIENQRAWSQQLLSQAQRNQTMWESQQAEQMKDLAEIRGRRMNQFDYAVAKTWNKDEEVQDNVAQNAVVARLIEALQQAGVVNKPSA